ncbi:type VI secretion system Vgr family protein [Xenorhabdus szentirmaii]|uniref:type VI secretion system Vgr family protein n=1 Tax=Xenorhabdus szentirmaii TaxID=290112 RepID=UPI000C05788A|nr:type VI secretion system tip protein TssI/VgrG [Xenorhabdus szentirmaii]PHM41232.1 type VI secretion system substrate VgrG1b [Xenorhabdus szentirmaii]
MERKFIAYTSSSEKYLHFKSLKGIERLSEAYEFEIQLLSEKKLDDPISLQNTVLTIEIKNKSVPTRYLSGNIEKISYAPFYKYDDELYLYTTTVRPKLCNLKKNMGYSIWQNKTVPDIISDIFKNAGISFKNQLIEKYRTWEYCVKHNETDFDFVHRLMEHEGIYYYFKHDKGSHTMILVDSPQSHDPMPGYEEIKYINLQHSLKGKGLDEYIYDWNVTSTTIPSTYSIDDYDFRKSRAKLYTAIQTAISSVTENSEIFIWPGRFIKSEEGQFYARVRQQASEAKSELIDAKGNVLGIAPGHTFTLLLPNDIKGDDHNDYFITGAHYFFYETPYLSCATDHLPDKLDKNETRNTVKFDAIPANTPWKPPAVTPWPKVTGLETAVVTGPKDKKIWTDKYGRIKVKFRWDKDDKKDDTRSCWIRVATYWAGWQYGNICVPRVGEEVVISFINGDPDKPLVVGSTYNNENMPPWELPEHETRVGIMSNTKGAKHDKANYLFFDDEPDKELFNLHAERDMNISVEKDKKVTIDGNRTTEIKKQQKDTIEGDAGFTYKSNHEITIDKKDKLTVKGGQQETIQKGRKTDIDGGDTYKLKGNLSAKIDGNWVQDITGITQISSPNSITIKSDTNVIIDCPQTFWSAKLFSISFLGASLSIVGTSTSQTGNSNSVTGNSNRVTGANLSSTALDVNNSVTCKNKSATKIESTGVAINNSEVSINKSSTNISNSSLHIIS